MQTFSPRNIGAVQNSGREKTWTCYSEREGGEKERKIV